MSCRLGTLAVALSIGALAAPAQAAQPDFSGVWTWDQGSGAGRSNLAASWPKDPPLTREAAAKVAEYRKLVEPNGDTPGGFCVGSGMPASMLGSGGYPMEIIQRPEQITVVYEAHNEIRRIYTGGQKIDPRDIIPSRNGTSFGKWEGDTLVVETIALKEAIDQTSAHSADAKIVERYRLTKDEKGNRILSAELTMTDPAFYTKPVTVTKTWRAVENGRLMPYECTEPEWEDHIEKLRQAATEKK